MQRFRIELGVVAVLLVAASVCLAAPNPAGTITGIVRDAQGVPQMGALVEVLSTDAAISATALTDLRGRYLILNLVPGRYQVRASATLLVPALRSNLQLQSGARAVVNLTLSGLFDTAAWLPIQRRRSDEPSDDWTWTLRSAANRPVLRMVEDGQVVFASSSAAESRAPMRRNAAAVRTGDGGFGTGGVHHTFSSARELDSGQGRMSLHADLAGVHGPTGSGLASAMSGQVERRLGPASVSRASISYQSHPEMINPGGAAPYDTVRVATAQKTEIGDFGEIEAGSALEAIHAGGYVLSARPFFRATVHPRAEWAVGYALASSPDLQGFDSLDGGDLDLPVAVLRKGRLQTTQGTHQEIFLGRKSERQVIRISLYRDAIGRAAVSGGGASGLDAPVMPASLADGVLLDSATGSIEMLSDSFRTRGWNVMFTQAISPGLWMALEYSTGSALALGESPDGELSLRPESAKAAAIALKGRLSPMGTKVRASYRWQPESAVTAVNPYAAFSDQAYLSFHVRQPVRFGRLLPAGAELTIDVSNLLEQGYRPFVSRDGQTLYLAESPRSLQAGVAFNF